MIDISHLDHLVLTVADSRRSIDFYTRVLGFKAVTFGDNRKALVFGQQKINLHVKGQSIAPHAQNPVCGSADLCFIAQTALEQVIAHLRHHGVKIESDIVERTGARGKIRSIYLRDPDQNLIEISNYL